MGADESSLDNRATNAVMMAAASANTDTWHWFYERHFVLKARGFNWDQRNVDSRNIYNICSKKGTAAGIRRQLGDLASKNLLSRNGPHGDEWQGESSAHTRTPGPRTPGTKAHARQINRGYGGAAAASQWNAGGQWAADSRWNSDAWQGGGNGGSWQWQPNPAPEWAKDRNGDWVQVWR